MYENYVVFLVEFTKINCCKRVKDRKDVFLLIMLPAVNKIKYIHVDHNVRTCTCLSIIIISLHCIHVPV